MKAQQPAPLTHKLQNVVALGRCAVELLRVWEQQGQLGMKENIQSARKKHDKLCLTPDTNLSTATINLPVFCANFPRFAVVRVNTLGT